MTAYCIKISINILNINFHVRRRLRTVNNKNRKRPTQQGVNLGLIERENTNKAGIKYYSVVYEPKAQQFIVDNLAAIIGEGYNNASGHAEG